MAVRFEEGRYRGRVLGQALTESGDKACAELTFWVGLKLAAGGLAAVPGGGARRTVRLWLTEAGAPGAVLALGQLGAVPARFGQLDPYAPDGVCYVGREADLECVHREYEGQVREDWNVARPQPAKLSDQRVADLDLRLGHLLKGEPGNPPPAATPPATPPAEPVDDDPATY